MAEKVLAYHVGSRNKRYVPEHWLSDTGPFPGQWRPAPSTVAELGRETETLPEDFQVESPAETPEPIVAGDGPGSGPAPSKPKGSDPEPSLGEETPKSTRNSRGNSNGRTGQNKED